MRNHPQSLKSHFRLTIFLVFVLCTGCLSDEDIIEEIDSHHPAIIQYKYVLNSHLDDFRKLKTEISSYRKSDHKGLSMTMDKYHFLFRELNLASTEFLSQLGFTQSDLSDILQDNDETLLTILSISLIAVLDTKNAEQEDFQDSQFHEYLTPLQTSFITQDDGLSWAEVGGCALAALGIDVIADLRTELHGKKMTKKILKKAFKKVAGRLLGYITGWGLVITAGYFIGCLALNHFLL